MDVINEIHQPHAKFFFFLERTPYQFDSIQHDMVLIMSPSINESDKNIRRFFFFFDKTYLA